VGSNSVDVGRARDGDVLDEFVRAVAQLARLAVERERAVTRAIRASEVSPRDAIEDTRKMLVAVATDFRRRHGREVRTDAGEAQLTDKAIKTAPSAISPLDEWFERAAQVRRVIASDKVPWTKAKRLEQESSHQSAVSSLVESAPAGLAWDIDQAVAETAAAARTAGQHAAAERYDRIAAAQSDVAAADAQLPLPYRLLTDPGWAAWDGSPGTGRLTFQVGTIVAGGVIADMHSRTSRPPRQASPDESNHQPADRISIEADIPVIPAVVDLDVHGGLFTFDADLVRSVVLKALAATPGGRFRADVFDPQRLGDSVNFLFGLGESAEQVIGLKVRSTERELAELLTELEEHLTFVTQKYLQGQYDSLTAYNLAAGEVAEPYRALVLFDYPHGFVRAGGYLDEDLLTRLAKIIAVGPRCGVYPLVSLTSPDFTVQGTSNVWGVLGALPFVDTTTRWDLWQARAAKLASQPEPQKPEIPPAAASHLSWAEIESGRPLFSGGCTPNWTFRADHLPDAGLVSTIIKAVERRLVAVDDVRVDRERVLSLYAARQLREAERDRVALPPILVPSDPTTWWQKSSADGLRVPFGRSGARDVALLRLDSTTQSTALVGGRPGAGKSVLFHSLILGLCELYPPSDLDLYLVDFKEGVEFKVYAEHQLPHARVVAIESDREFGVSVLEALAAEMERRGSLFRESGGEDVNLASYRARTGRPLARQLLIIDEFHVLFERDDKVAGRAAEVLDRLVRQGRAFGVHVVLGSQTLAGTAALGRHTLNQIPVRLALQCSDADSRLLLADDNPDARLLSRPGEGILNTAGGHKDGNQRFQTAWVPPDEREAAVRALRAKAEATGFTRRPVVFEGNQPASIDEADLVALQELAAAGSLTLGLPLSLGGAVSWTLHRRPGSNLLVVGDEEDAGALAVAAGALGLAGGMNVVLLDFLAVDNAVTAALDPLIDAGRIALHRRRTALDELGKLSGMIEERRDLDDTSAATTVVLISGLHRARDLEPSYDATGPDAALETVLRDGPDVGVHVLATCDKVVSLERRLSRSALRELAVRVAFRMGTEDSIALLDSDIASKMRGSQTVMDDQDEVITTKFRPWRPFDAGRASLLATRSPLNAREDGG
jgi:S-DNA-T family DNA segregation ATPase FtsK/SpoIIIE